VLTCCWSVKGGAGVTVVASALACASSASARTVVVDLCGDVPAALGLPDPDGPGVAEWSRGDDGHALAGALVDVHDRLALLPRGRGPLGTLPLDALATLATEVVVDAGCLDRGQGPRAVLTARATRSLLVTRPCFLALRRAARVALRPTGIVVVREPGRALATADITAVVGAPVVAEVPFDPAISRAVDAGLLVARCPQVLSSSLALAS
jgi:hypothetical protein